MEGKIVSVLTIRLPDEQHQRLKQLAKSQGISVNKMIEALSNTAITEFDTLNRFKIRSAMGDKKLGLELLEKLEQGFK